MKNRTILLAIILFSLLSLILSGCTKSSVEVLRRFIRDRLNRRNVDLPNLRNRVIEQLNEIIDGVYSLKGTLLAIIGRRFPSHLIPAPNFNINDMRNHYMVRIF